MDTVYFPFTFLDATTTAHWLGYFPGLRVYCPVDETSGTDMAELARQKRVDLRALCPENSAQVLDLCRSYKHWKDAHTGVDSHFFRQTSQTVPFFDETTISRLKQDIADSVNRKPQTDDSLLTAQLFLQLTHEHDREQIMLNGSLKSLDGREKEILAALQGDDPAPLQPDMDGEVASAADPSKSAIDSNYRDVGAYLTAERIRAWALLAARDSAVPNVLVTDSRAVFDHIQEMVPQARVVAEDLPEPISSGDKSAWQEALEKFLGRLTAGNIDAPQPSATESAGLSATSFFWNVMVLPETNLSDFISFFVGSEQIDGADETPQTSPSSVVIVGVDRCRRKLT